MRGPHSEETKRKIGEANRGKVRTLEYRQAVSDSLRGRIQSEATVQKRSQSIRNSSKIKDRPKQQAAERGEKFHTTGIPCRNGHTGPRYTNGGECYECALAIQRDPKRRAYTLWWGAQDRAKKLGLPCNVTREYIESIWPKDDRCPILQQAFVYPDGKPKRRGPLPLTPSIDRIRPELGYVEGNVAVISHYVNTLKGNCSDPAVFKRLASWLEEQ
jgi:NUMOD3 motif